MGAMVDTSITTSGATARQSVYLLNSLRTVYTRALSNTLSKCSYPAFAACFPTPATKKPETLKTVWKQIIDKIESKALAEFDTICVERDLDNRFGELEDVLKDATNMHEKLGDNEVERQAENIALHTLPPADLFLATLAPQLAPLAKEVRNSIDDQRNRNGALLAELLARRAEIEATVKKLEEVVADMENANTALYAASKDMEGTAVD